MLHIALVNPPFASVWSPSLALSQLRSVVRNGPHRDRVTIQEYFVNFAFAKHFGLDFYNYVSTSSDTLNVGFGEWIFRRAAFPEVPDNAEAYFERFRGNFPWLDAERYWQYTLSKREGLEALIESSIDRFALDRADIVAFTSTFAQNMSTFALARAIKRRNPDVITAVGGANCESPMGEVLAAHVEAIDYVFSGSGLVSFPEFLGCILDGQRDRCTSIDGVFGGAARAAESAALLEGGTGRLRMADQSCSSHRAIGRELDIDTPLDSDYHYYIDLFHDEFPEMPDAKPWLYFETSRGCWWGEKAHCTFCGLNGTTMHYRSMAPALAIGQFKSLFAHAPRVKLLQAVDNILPKTYLTEVLPFIDTPKTVQMFYEVKADISEEEFKTLAKARILRIQPGIEALATSTLKLMKKGTTAHQNIEFLKNAARHGVGVAWNLLVGFPGEDEEVYRKYVEDLPALVHLPPPAGVYPIRFDRYSPYFTRADEYKLKLRPMDFYELVYPFPKESLKDLAYFFTDETPDPPYAVATSRWIERLRAAVDPWRSLWDSAKHADAPILRFERPESGVVLDTRSGELVQHDLTPAAHLLLRHLSRPKRLADALAFAGDDAEQALRDLRGRRLLFEERDRVVSLVLPCPGEDERPATSEPIYGHALIQWKEWG